MFESKNSYVLNKYDADAIVYEDAKGTITRITRECFDGEEDFQRFKKWSDEEYNTTELERHKYTNHSISMDAVKEGELITESAEDSFTAKLSDQDKARLLSVLPTGITACLSLVQRRRLKMMYFNGLSTKEIASLEGVSERRINRSINLARSKLKKYLTFCENRGPKTRENGV